MYKTERLALKVLRRDKDALRRLAAAEGEAMSVVIRRLIRQAARARGILLPETHGAHSAAQEQGQEEAAHG